jgi:hypothetical protein
MLPSEASELIGQISVEIDGLHTVAAGMQSELDKSFRVQVPKVNGAMEKGATIGWAIQGAEWAHLQNVYTDYLQQTVDGLHALDAGSFAVAQAASTIAEQYGNSDAFAKATVSDVQEVIAPPPPAPSDPLPATQTAGVGYAN